MFVDRGPRRLWWSPYSLFQDTITSRPPFSSNSSSSWSHLDMQFLGDIVVQKVGVEV